MHRLAATESPNNFNKKYNVIIDTTIVWSMNINSSLLVKSLVWFSLWCLMPLSTIFQLYRGSQFIGEEYLEKTTNLP
jgi:hypothetical protein